MKKEEGTPARLRLVAAVLGALSILASCATVDPSIVRLPISSTAGSISGRVTALGAPLPGAVVSTVPPTANAATDGSGRFTVASVAPQTLLVVVRASGLLPGSKPVSVLPGQTSTVEIALIPIAGATILGRVTDGVMPIPTALVTTVPRTIAQTAALDGTFFLTGLAPGQYHIEASMDGYYPGTVSVTLGDSQEQPIDVALTRRFDGTITGVVTDGTNPVGSPTRLVTISRFFGARKGVITRPLQPNVQPAPPKAQFPLPLVFEYYFNALEAGPHVIQAQCAGFVPGIKEVDVLPPVVGNGEIILSVDGRTAAIAGTVIDPILQPHQGARVSLAPVSLPAIATTTSDGSGRYRFFNLTPGTFDVSVAGGLFTTTTVRLAVAGGHTADGTVRLLP